MGWRWFGARQLGVQIVNFGLMSLSTISGSPLVSEAELLHQRELFDLRCRQAVAVLVEGFGVAAKRGEGKIMRNGWPCCWVCFFYSKDITMSVFKMSATCGSRESRKGNEKKT